MIDERQIGREIARETPAMVREMHCQPCGVGAAIARVERRHGIGPTFDWRGEGARAAGHRCPLTTWDKGSVQQQLTAERVPGEDDGAGAAP